MHVSTWCNGQLTVWFLRQDKVFSGPLGKKSVAIPQVDSRGSAAVAAVKGQERYKAICMCRS